MRFESLWWPDSWTEPQSTWLFVGLSSRVDYRRPVISFSAFLRSWIESQLSAKSLISLPFATISQLFLAGAGISPRIVFGFCMIKEAATESTLKSNFSVSTGYIGVCEALSLEGTFRRIMNSGSPGSICELLSSNDRLTSMHCAGS